MLLPTAIVGYNRCMFSTKRGRFTCVVCAAHVATAIAITTATATSVAIYVAVALRVQCVTIR